MKKFYLLLCLLIVQLAAHGQTTTINFNSLPHNDEDLGNPYIHNESSQSWDFKVSPTSLDQVITDTSPYGSPTTHKVLTIGDYFGGSATVSIKKHDGSRFDFNSMSITAQFAIDLNIVGYRSGTAVVGDNHLLHLDDPANVTNPSFTLVTLNWTNIDEIRISDNSGANLLYFDIDEFTTTSPTTITSLTANAPTTTNTATVNYTATFAASVTGLTASAFTLTQGGSVSGASFGTITGSGTSWTIPVNTGTGDGTVQLSFTNGSGTSPSVSNTAVGGTFTIDKTLPTVVINRSDPTPISDNVLDFQAIFSEVVTGVDKSDFTLTTTGGITFTTPISLTPVHVDPYPDGSVYNITVNNVTGNGTARLDLNGSGTGIADAAGNAPAAHIGDGVFDIDQTRPTVFSINPAVSTPTNATSVDFTVTFSEAVTGVDASDFT